MLASGKKTDLDEHRDDQDGDAEIADPVIDPVHRQEQRLGDEVEVAPVDQPVEFVELERIVVAVDDVDFLGAGEEPRVRGAGPARRDGQRGGEIVALVALGVADLVCQEFRIDMGLGIGDECCGPILVGEAEPGIGGGERDGLLLLDVGVGLLLQALVAEHADQAFVQDVVAERVRRPVARDQRIGIKRDRRRAFVGDLVLDGEHVLVVDRDGAAEFEPFAVVPDERHGLADGERARTLLPPHGVRNSAASLCAPLGADQPNSA